MRGSAGYLRSTNGGYLWACGRTALATSLLLILSLLLFDPRGPLSSPLNVTHFAMPSVALSTLVALAATTSGVLAQSSAFTPLDPKVIPYTALVSRFPLLSILALYYVSVRIVYPTASWLYCLCYYVLLTMFAVLKALPNRSPNRWSWPSGWLQLV